MVTTDAYGNVHDESGRFSEKSNSAPGLGAALSPTPASLRDLDEIVYEVAATDPRLPGTWHVASPSSMSYLDEDGVRFRVALSDSSYVVRSEESEAEISNIIFRIETESAAHRIRRAQRIVEDFVAVIDQHRDMQALSRVAEELGRDLHQLDPTAPSVRISEYRGAVRVGDPDEHGEVLLDDFTLRNEDFDGAPSLCVTVPGATKRDREESPRQFHLVCRPDWDIEAWGEEDARRLSEWETRGLLAEINRRAEVPEGGKSLATELFERAIDARRMEKMRHGVG